MSTDQSRSVLLMLARFRRSLLRVAAFLIGASVAFGEVTVTIENETVEDGETEDHSSAQVLMAGPNVTIEDGGNSTYTAGRRIILRPGFTAEEGSSFRAFIDPTLDPDQDYDDMDDAWETSHGLNPSVDDSQGDLDGDGYTNLLEYLNGTLPNDSDTDDDGLSDGAEVNTHGTDPLLSDTDQDGMDDGWEVAHGLDPSSSSDGAQDADSDGITNLQEHEDGSSPVHAHPIVTYTDFEEAWETTIRAPVWAYWRNVSGDDWHWLRDSGGTPSLSTGPTGPSLDHTLATSAGFYLYMETSEGYLFEAGDKVFFESGTYDTNGASLELSFYYHMYGADIGTLNVDVYANGAWNEAVWSISGQQHTSDTAEYTKATVDLSSYSGSIKLRFRGVAAGYYRGDIAIDDLRVYDRAADQDYDEMRDSWETAHGLDTEVDDSQGDLDGDGYANILEYQNGTLPNDSDSDDDGLFDGSRGQYSWNRSFGQ